MIDLNATNEWQHRDPETGLVLPWYTKSFLDELVTWDLSNKVVFEYGAGASTLWWNKKCKKLYGVESNADYHAAVTGIIGNDAVIMLPNQMDVEGYANSIKYCREQFDIIIIDGDPVEWRDACIVAAIKHIKNNGIIICDNWQQKDVWISEYALTLLGRYDHYIYKQEGHDHWQTAYFKITK